MRLRETEAAVGKLTARVAALEDMRPDAERSAKAPDILGRSGDRPVPKVELPKIEQAPQPPQSTSPEPLTPAPRPRPQPAAPPPSAIQPTTPSAADHEALESRIGSRWLLYVGVVAIVIGVSYFEKLAIDNHWVNETWRVIQGSVAGLVCIAAGLRIAKKSYRLYGQILAGAGVAILYVSIYAAFNLYHLINHPVAFGLMSAITILGAGLANSQGSQGLALVALSGGFATPFLLPTVSDAETALFTYDSLLIAGTIVLARRRDWPVLNIVSYALTALTFLSWAAVFYTPAKYLPTELFLTLFCVMFLYALWSTYHSEKASAKLQRAILWTAPFGYYILSLANLFEHSAALLIYLVVLALVGVVSASRTNSWIRLLFWFAVAAPLLVWTERHSRSVWLAGGVAAWAGVYVLNLAGLFEATLDDGDRFDAADIALLHVNALGAYLGAYLLIDPVRSVACAPLAAAFAILNLAFAYAVRKRQREEALHFIALAATLVTIAIALQFDGAWVTMGWATEGTVVTWLGLRERRRWLRSGGLALFGAAVVRLVVSQTWSPTVGEMILLNSRALSGVFVSALTYLLAYMYHRYGEAPSRKAAVAAGLVLAKLLLLAVAASEIVAYWLLHAPPPFEPDAQVVVAALVAGTAIVWLGLRRQEEWVRAIGGVVVALAAFTLFVVQMQPAPAGYTIVLNGRVAAGVLAVLTLYGLVAMHRRFGRHIAQLSTNIAILTTTASLLTLSLLTSEIDAFWAARGASHVWSVAREGLQSVAWAGIGGFLIWYGLSTRRLWSRGIGAVLLGFAVVRLLRLHFASPPVAYVIVANARVMTSIVVIALLYGLARLYAKDDSDPEEGASTPSTALRLIANALTLTLLTSEITAYWHVFDARQLSRSASADMHFAREMMVSITWAVYATILAIVGLLRKYAPIRYFAMAVFAVTIVKVFAIDLAELDRIYRVLSIIGLGLTLLLTSYLYQKLNADAEHP
jgi:uncharacterized membrane protein